MTKRIDMLLFILIFILLAGCYTSKEHRQWDNRDKNNLSDNHFYLTLKDTCAITEASLKMNYPYISVRADGYFHSYAFDKDKNVFSNAWVNDKPELGKVLANQYRIGYYKICGDTLTIEQIGSWTFMGRPWKYVHKKTLGLISSDTLKISQEQLNIKQRDKIAGRFDFYMPIRPK